jgi:ribonuclease HI
MKEIRIYTDGACLGNPGPGGWAAVMRYNEHLRVLSGGMSPTTNNRMEVLAAVCALESLTEPCRVQLFTDSRYLCDAVEKRWLKGWLKNGWLTAAKKPVKNKDLWQRLLPLLDKHHVNLRWVQGHAGDPDNERCDQLAKAAAQAPKLTRDPGYPENA